MSSFELSDLEDHIGLVVLDSVVHRAGWNAQNTRCGSVPYAYFERGVQTPVRLQITDDPEKVTCHWCRQITWTSADKPSTKLTTLEKLARAALDAKGMWLTRNEVNEVVQLIAQQVEGDSDG